MRTAGGFAASTRALALFAVLAFFFAPIAWIFANSVGIGGTSGGGFAPTLEHYRALLDGPFARNLANTILATAFAVGLATALATPAAYAAARRPGRLADGLTLALLAPRCVPPIVALLPLVSPIGALGSENAGRIGLILSYQPLCLPLIFWLVRGHFAALPPDLSAAWRLSGVGPAPSFWRIVSGPAGSGIAASALLTFVLAWGHFSYAHTLPPAAGQPASAAALALLDPDGADHGRLAAAATLTTAPPIVIALLAARRLVEGLRWRNDRR